MTKAIFIDAQHNTIYATEVSGLKDLQRLVQGLIEVAPATDTSGSTLYVDEEGLLKNYNYAFSYNGSDPYYGNGVLIGAADEHGNDTDVLATIEEVKQRVRFYVRIGG